MKKLADGTVAVYRYHRATGLPLRGEPFSAEFIEDYAAAEKTTTARIAGDTFNNLIREYTSSIEFETKLSAGSQREYRRMLTKAEGEFGDMPRDAMNNPDVRKDFLDWRASSRAFIWRPRGRQPAFRRSPRRSHGPSIMAASDTNHIVGFRRLYHADRSEIIWLPEHVEAFMAVAPIEIAAGA